MKTLEKTVSAINDWFNDGCVGSLTLFRAPKSRMLDMIGEQTIKLREMDEETRDAVFKLFDLLDSEKIELFRDKDGYPDRVRVIRRF